MSAFKEEVDAGARAWPRPRLSGRRIGLLRLLLFVPAVRARRRRRASARGLAWAGGLYLAGLCVAVGVGVRRRRSGLVRRPWSAGVRPSPPAR